MRSRNEHSIMIAFKNAIKISDGYKPIDNYRSVFAKQIGFNSEIEMDKHNNNVSCFLGIKQNNI